MLDTERSTTPADDDGFSALLAEAATIEPDAPTELPADPATPATDPANAPPAPVATPPAEPAATATPPEETPPAGAPPAEPSASPPTEPSAAPSTWTFKVDGREVTLDGAREDGENIVIPKAVWGSQVKNFLADRGAIARQEAQLRSQLHQVQQQQGAREATAAALLKELDRIMEQPEDQSFDEWERFRGGYQAKKVEAETEFWKQKATTGDQHQAREQEEREIREILLPRVTESLARWVDDAMAAVKPQLGELLDAESEKELRALIHERFVEEADAGRVFFKTGRTVEGTRLPELQPDFQRLTAVVDREVRVARKALERVAAAKKTAATVAEAARKNAEDEARRKGAANAPPAVSTKATPSEPVAKAQVGSWDDLMAEAAKL